MEIIQTNEPGKSVYTRDPDAVEVTLGERSLSARIRVYFGANVKRAKMYALGRDNGQPVLVPVEQNGYKVNNRYTNGAGSVSFNLNDSAIDLFGVKIASMLTADINRAVEVERRYANFKGSDFDSIYAGLPECNGDIELQATVDDNLCVRIDCSSVG